MTLKELKSFYNGKRVLVTGHTGFKDGQPVIGASVLVKGTP